MLLKLVDIKNEAKDTKSFFFEAEKKVFWLPGQYLYFTLPKLKAADSKGPTRYFTISSSPTEGKLIRISTRIRKNSGFKKTLSSLKLGSKVEAEGPSGTYILDKKETGNHILIAGGIGITPFRSFIKYNIDNKLKDNNIHLIYSNSTPEQITFRDELKSWDRKNKNIKVSFVITRPKDSKEKWSGPTGRIDKKMFQSLITDHRSLTKKTFWLCGPPPFVDAMETLLGSMKISSNKVRSEKFSGY